MMKTSITTNRTDFSQSEGINNGDNVCGCDSVGKDVKLQMLSTMVHDQQLHQQFLNVRKKIRFDIFKNN